MRSAEFMVAISLALVAGCGDDGGGTTLSCNGSSCTCEPGAACDLAQSACGDSLSCSLDCSDENVCEGACGESCSIDCAGGSTCTVTVGGHSSVSCSDGSTCRITCMGSCSLSCSGGSTCELTCPGEEAQSLPEGGECAG